MLNRFESVAKRWLYLAGDDNNYLASALELAASTTLKKDYREVIHLVLAKGGFVLSGLPLKFV